jgi:hypothetical protein
MRGFELHLCKRIGNDGNQGLRFELDRREIDGDLERRRPMCRLPTGLPQDPLADRNDQAILFRE